MANLAGFVAQAGLVHRAAEDYDEQQGVRTHAAKARDLGIAKMDAEQKLLPEETRLKQLRQEVDGIELEFKKTHLPKLQQAESTETDVRLGEAQTKKALQPGAKKLAAGTQQTQILDLAERQTANLWNMVKLGDVQGATSLLSNSELLFPGRKFKGMQRGAVPVQGPDGKPMVGADGQPVREGVLMLDPEDGKDPIFIPEKSLDALVAKHNTKLEKVGNSLVRVGPGGKVEGAYEPSEAGANPETGDVYFTKGPKAGQIATGGINGDGGAPRPPGAGGGRKATAAIDDRVKMAIDKVILPKFGGRFEGGMFFPDEANKDVAVRATQLAGEYVRGGMDPEAAGARAVKEAEREEAVKKAGGKEPGKPGGYGGPTPWKK
jgi:hypothetical protein